MRRHHRNAAGGSSVYNNKANGAPIIPDPLALIRTFNSETNPSRPIRPSPLTASQIQGMPLDLLDRIRSFPLFLSAPESFLVAIASHLRLQLHSPHDYILTEGDDAKAMYWLVRGAVAVTSRDGESTYAELKPGAFFGEIGILMDIPRTATIIARSRCLLVVLSKEDLTKELPKFPEVEQAIRDEAQERLTILYKKKRETGGDVSKLPARGGKRAREGITGAVNMGDEGSIGSNGVSNTKKRKSPSPGVVDSFLETSALGSGLVNVRQLLRELPLFSSLPPEILHFLGLSAQPMTYPPFTDIVKQDTQGREIYFIVRGEVEVVYEQSTVPNGGFFLVGYGPQRGDGSGAVRITRLKKGQYFGEVASLSLAPRRTATVRSVTEVECLMITEQVLNELWRRCPIEIRQQVEVTARNRLDSLPVDPDVEMTNTSDTPTPSFDDLEIGDRPPKSSKRPAYSTVTVSAIKPETPHKPSRIEDIPIIEPFDPDPFLGVDIDNMRSKSRRGSLAPPSPDSQQNGGGSEAQNNQNPLVPRAVAPSTTKVKHVTTPPEQHISTKRPRTLLRTLPRRPSQFSKGTFPDSILTLIFNHLNIWQLMHLRRVSSHWSKLLTSSPDLLHVLDLREFNRKVTDEVLIKSICPFAGSRPFVVDISNCFHITDEGFTVLAAMCGANAKAWRMKSVWDITGQAVLEMANKARGLEEIDLSNCRKVSDNLLARVVGWVVQDTPLLAQQQQRGRQNPSSKPGNQALMHAPPGTVIGCPKLKRLTLSYCKHVTDRSMAHLAVHAASRLEQIDLTRCTTITDQGFQHWSIYQFSRLRKLCLADCTYLTDNAIVYLTSAAKGLRELDLSFCCALSDTATEVLALGCPHLTVLKLSFCGSAVSDSSLRCIGLHLLELRELSVRGCVRVTGIGVESVVEGCHNLEVFNVSQCKNLTRWLEQGGVEKCSRLLGRNVKFETVAQDPTYLDDWR